jgi:hypothetical protein
MRVIQVRMNVCIFSTGYEYSMYPANNSPYDLTLFGGKPFHDDNWKLWNSCDTRHSWSADDTVYIEGVLRRFCADLAAEMPVWSEYEQNIQGTNKLFRALDASVPKKSVRWQFILGCVIYHQLSYCPKMSAICAGI